jgi:hypothetical protein
MNAVSTAVGWLKGAGNGLSSSLSSLLLGVSCPSNFHHDMKVRRSSPDVAPELWSYHLLKM